MTASEDNIEAFVDRKLSQGCGYDDIRDHTVFDFNDKEDLAVFTREVTSKEIKVNVTLHGADYLAANLCF